MEQDTRSVALDLGLLSLNPESRQVHYLGSSSGSLFASLLQTKNTGGSSFGNSRRDDPSTEVHGGNDGDNRIDMSQLEDVRKVVESLYEQLRKVCEWRDFPQPRLLITSSGSPFALRL